MKFKQFSLIYLCLVLALISCACSNPHPFSIGPCIKPSFTYAFPTYATAQPGNYSLDKVRPGGDWRIESILPGAMPEHIGSLLIRHHREIWMIVSRNSDGVDLVYRYRIDLNKWNSYQSIDGMAVVPETLILTTDGTLWGIGIYSSSPGLLTPKTPSYISRFDEATDQFRFVKDIEGKLQFLVAPRTPPMVQADRFGKLWMILGNGFNTPSGLYCFDPVTETLSRHLPEIEFTQRGSLAVAPNNDIWIFDPISEAKLIQYDPTTKNFVNDFINFTGWGIQNWRGDLYFDRSGRLWSGNDGWFDFTDPDMPVWYQIIPSPVFISDYYDGENQYIWTSPRQVYQSSNGWYWFSFLSNGIVRLNPETGEWCRFTNEYSPVIEDDYKNIRIIIEGKIYLYEIKP